jgi:hypothetical protein
LGGLKRQKAKTYTVKKSGQQWLMVLRTPLWCATQTPTFEKKFSTIFEPGLAGDQIRRHADGWRHT